MYTIRHFLHIHNPVKTRILIQHTPTYTLSRCDPSIDLVMNQNRLLLFGEKVQKICTFAQHPIFFFAQFVFKKRFTFSDFSPLKRGQNFLDLDLFWQKLERLSIRNMCIKYRRAATQTDSHSDGQPLRQTEREKRGRQTDRQKVPKHVSCSLSQSDSNLPHMVLGFDPRKDKDIGQCLRKSQPHWIKV